MFAKRFLGWLLVSAFFGLAACYESVKVCGGARRALVVEVIDGDTIKLDDHSVVRYLGIDTPEIKSHFRKSSACYAGEARNFNAALVLNQLVYLEDDVECFDKYGRRLAYVSVGGQSVNRLLVEEGFARVLIIAPNVRYADELYALEEQAKRGRKGLWGACF